MVTIAWNPLGFHLVKVFSNDNNYNAEYYRDDILTTLIQFLQEAGGTKFILHADTAKPHSTQKCRPFCAENGLRLATHPLYSPDRAPSDFVLFGHVKNRLQVNVFPSHGELLIGI
jgi:hypothetical protein